MCVCPHLRRRRALCRPLDKRRWRTHDSAYGPQSSRLGRKRNNRPVLNLQSQRRRHNRERDESICQLCGISHSTIGCSCFSSSHLFLPCCRHLYLVLLLQLHYLICNHITAQHLVIVAQTIKAATRNFPCSCKQQQAPHLIWLQASARYLQMC